VKATEFLALPKDLVAQTGIAKADLCSTFPVGEHPTETTESVEVSYYISVKIKLNA
jgi:hypothetical protein